MNNTHLSDTRFDDLNIHPM